MQQVGGPWISASRELGKHTSSLSTADGGRAAKVLVHKTYFKKQSYLLLASLHERSDILTPKYTI